MTKFNLLFLLTILLSSCNSFEKKDLEGEWVIKIDNDESLEDVEPTMPFIHDLPILIFEENDTYVCKNGFFKFDRDSIRYYGEKTQFKIKGDSLLIFDPVAKKFDSQKIVELSKNKIVLETTKKNLITLIPFKSKTYEKMNPPIDKIVVSKSPCYGSCPSNSTVIDNKGNFLFYGNLHNLKNGFFSAKVSSQITKEIFNELKYIDFHALKPEYSSNWTDMASSTITFISKGKMIKTVYDYGGESPFELRRLIRNISYLYQNISLQTLKTNPISVYDFTSGTQTIDLQESEMFYLFSELFRAKTVVQNSEKLPFTGRYSLTIPENEEYKNLQLYVRSMSTNGRIFKIQQKDKTYKTVDLGYNFFEENHLIKFKNGKVSAR